MHKTIRPGQSVLLFIIVWLIIFQSVSESSYRIPQFSQQEAGTEKGKIILNITKPADSYLSYSSSETERILRVIRQDNLPDKKNQRQKVLFYITRFIFGKRILDYGSTYTWRVNTTPSDQMRRSLIAYIHHKEDQQ